MSISTSGIGSGIDIRGLVEQLLESEGAQKSLKFDTDEAEALAKITGYGTLKSALAEFQSDLGNLKKIDNFQQRKATSSDSEIFKVIAETSSVPSTYSIEITQLAQSQKLTSQDFVSTSTIIGTGTLKFTFGTVEHSIDITAEEQTLEGIRNKINDTSASTGVSASIVTVDAGSRLVLSSEKTGDNNAFTVSVVDDGDDNNTDNAGLSQLISANMTVTQAALDSIVKIDGATLTSSSNTVSSAITGVTIDLIKINEGAPETLTISLDQAQARTYVNQFISSYNSVFDTINELTKYDDSGAEDVAGVLCLCLLD